MSMHPKDRAIQKDILTTGQFRVKAGADLEEAGYATVDFDPPVIQLLNPRRSWIARRENRASSAHFDRKGR